MGCSVGWTATVAAFMATKLAGGPDLHPERSKGPERQRRMAKAGDFVSRWKGAARAAGKSLAAAIAGPIRLPADRPLEGRGAVLSDLSMHPASTAMRTTPFSWLATPPAP
jgi:hypothetical protein